MAFTEDLSVFFQVADFGVTATWTPSSTGVDQAINGIFDAQSTELPSSSPDVLTSAPRFLCAEADVSDMAENDDVLVNDTSFLVSYVDPDGTGVANVFLKKANGLFLAEGLSFEIGLETGGSVAQE